MLIIDSKKKLHLSSFIRKFFKFKLILIILVLLIFSFLLFFCGILFYKNGYVYKINQVINVEKFSSPYSVVESINLNLKSFFTDVEKVYLDIKLKNLKQMSAIRKTALMNDVLYDKDNKRFKASIRAQGKNIPIRINFKSGKPSLHLSNNWSFKVKTKKSNLFGLTDFSLMDAKRRNYLLEWYARKLYSKEGIIYKEYKFINLFLNGEDKGIYVIDENYTENLLTKNNRRDSTFIRFNQEIMFHTSCCDYPEQFVEYLYATNIDAKSQKIDSETELNKLKNFNIASRLLDDFRTKKLSVEEIFDIDLMAKSFALSDLINGQHAVTWDNMKFYFNPVTTKLEPVLEDFYNEITTYANLEPSLLHPGNPNPMRITDNFGFFYTRFFESKIFLEKYIYHLKRYSDKNFLRDFNNEIKNEFELNYSKILKHHPRYSFPFDMFEDNRKYISKFLDPYQPLFFSLWKKENNKIKLKVGNTSEFPLELKKIKIDYDNELIKLIDINNSSILLEKSYLTARLHKRPIKYDFLNIDLKYKNKINTITIFYKIPGLETEYSKKLINPQITKSIDDITFNKHKDTSLLFKDFVVLENQIILNKGQYNIDKDLIIPKNKTLLILPGAKINLLNGSMIISKSNILAQGTLKNPIEIYSSDNKGECLLIMDNVNQSIFKHVYFKNLSNCSNQFLELSGSVNFYNTNIVMNYVYFNNNIKGDDFLNIINSSFDLKNINFQNTIFDGLDIDFSEGKIADLKCRNCQNDAIDLSNSNVIIKNILAENIGDKAISVGENSVVLGSDITVNNAFMGLAVKDQSHVNINNIIVNNSNYGITSYIKKQEYNPSSGRINNFSYKNNEKDIVIEDGGKFIINKINYNDFISNVYKNIYENNLN